MKNVILIHGINGIPVIFEWLRAELESRNVEVILPSFPPQEGVTYSDWSDVMDSYKWRIGDDSIVVCYSIGNEFTIRYLVEHNMSIDTFIGLAGFVAMFHSEGRDVLNRVVSEFLLNDEEKRKFVLSSKKRYAIYSDNDHVIPFDILSAFPKEIDAEGIMVRSIGHMGKRSGLEKFPELLELVERNL